MAPNYHYVWSERGASSYGWGSGAAAAADYARALDLGAPLFGREWWGGPQLLLFAGNESGYRTACRRMWQEVVYEPDRPSEWAIRSCLFTSEPAVDSTELVEAAERMIEQPRNVSELAERLSRRHKDSSHEPVKSFPDMKTPRPYAKVPRGAGLYMVGLAYYRHADYDVAIDKLAASLTEDQKWPGKMIPYPALAMAYYRAGRVDEANSALDAANRVIDGWLSSILAAEIGTTPVPWLTTSTSFSYTAKRRSC